MDPRSHTGQSVASADELLSSVSRFCGWVVHEVNNPIAGIQNAFALLRPLIPADHPHARFADAIDREIARMTALTQYLRQMYGYEDPPRQAIPLGSCIVDAVRVLDPLSRARHVAFVLDLDSTTTPVKIHGRLAQAAIRHLLQHALEGAPSGSIRVRAWLDGGSIRLAVPEHVPGQSSGARSAGGPAGLALDVVRWLVGMLDGELIVTPLEDGVRELCIALPLATSRASA